MVFSIFGGSQVDIDVGMQIRLRPGFLPPFFDSQWLVVTKIDQGYPFARFYQAEQYEDDNGSVQTNVIMDEESAVSPDIILGVQ